MFENLLRIAMQENRIDELQRQKKSGDSATKTAPCDNPSWADTDTEICILAETFGEMKAGKIIETTLQELLQILPRQRKRSDAYKGVIAKLNQNGVTLVIQKKKRRKRI